MIVFILKVSSLYYSNVTIFLNNQSNQLWWNVEEKENETSSYKLPCKLRQN